MPQAEWLLADACEITSLDEAALQRCNVVIAATGDDKVNLVVSLLAKTEYGVPRVVARVNNPKNEWLFNESWGVDVAVSTPRLMSALVEEAVSVGDLVRLLRFSQGDANLVELTLPRGRGAGGHPGRRRGRGRRTPRWSRSSAGPGAGADPDDTLEAGDELLFVANQDVEDECVWKWWAVSGLWKMLASRGPIAGVDAVKVLGVVAKTHDSGIALVEDGVPELIFEEERFNRVKKTKKFPKLGLAAAVADLALAWPMSTS